MRLPQFRVQTLMVIVAVVGTVFWAFVKVPFAAVIVVVLTGPLLGVCHAAIRCPGRPLCYLNGAIQGGLIQGTCVALLVAVLLLFDLVSQPGPRHVLFVFGAIVSLVTITAIWTMFGIFVGLMAETVAEILSGRRRPAFTRTGVRHRGTLGTDHARHE